MSCLILYTWKIKPNINNKILNHVQVQPLVTPFVTWKQEYPGSTCSNLSSSLNCSYILLFLPWIPENKPFEFQKQKTNININFISSSSSHNKNSSLNLITKLRSKRTLPFFSIAFFLTGIIKSEGWRRDKFGFEVWREKMKIWGVNLRIKRRLMQRKLSILMSLDFDFERENFES